MRAFSTREKRARLRLIDKYAVRCGGGQNHRLDLSDGVLINTITLRWPEEFSPLSSVRCATGAAVSRWRLKCAR